MNSWFYSLIIDQFVDKYIAPLTLTVEWHYITFIWLKINELFAPISNILRCTASNPDIFWVDCEKFHYNFNTRCKTTSVMLNTCSRQLCQKRVFVTLFVTFDFVILFLFVTLSVMTFLLMILIFNLRFNSITTFELFLWVLGSRTSFFLLMFMIVNTCSFILCCQSIFSLIKCSLKTRRTSTIWLANGTL